MLAVEDASLRTADGYSLLSGIDLSIAARSKLAIVGPNGAGKSSLLRLMSGRTPPTSGSVCLDGAELSGISSSQRALRVAVVCQSDNPDPRLSLRDYVGLGRLPHRGRVPAAYHAEVVDDALTKVGLSEFADRHLGTLSGGERQRGAIARSIAQEPSLLLLDEPTNHLDPRARADMLALARDLPITVVAVLHDLALVTPFADTVAVLQGGRLKVHGVPARALAPAVVREVFAMDSFEITNPVTGRSLLAFDSPPTSPMQEPPDAFAHFGGLGRHQPVGRRTGSGLPCDGR